MLRYRTFYYVREKLEFRKGLTNAISCSSGKREYYGGCAFAREMKKVEFKCKILSSRLNFVMKSCKIRDLSHHFEWDCRSFVLRHVDWQGASSVWNDINAASLWLYSEKIAQAKIQGFAYCFRIRTDPFGPGGNVSLIDDVLIWIERAICVQCQAL